jgi:AraC-like DNA-binding protein
MAHTQDSIAVYVTSKEKEEIKETAKKEGKSMTRYLLDLHLERRNMATHTPSSEKDSPEVSFSKKKKDYSFINDSNMTDVEYFRKILNDAEKIKFHIVWGFDEQQADAFHHGFSSEEFTRRFKRLIATLGIR